MSFENGHILGRYRIRRRIAQGGMAEVYEAEQAFSGGIARLVALKVIRPEYAQSQDFREMFLDEARTACHLNHANIVHIYEVGDDDDVVFMAMELVSGTTLSHVGRTLSLAKERLSNEALFAIGIGICSALEAVHTLNIDGTPANLVHRDVSPHNILLNASGVLKLIDFGIAKAAFNRNLTLPGVTKGKAGYFSPEQAMGKTLDGRSDLFSLGVTLYKLASGHTPFDKHKTHLERNGALVRGQWESLQKVTPGLPPGFYAVVERATQVKPEERYFDAAEMREELEVVAFQSGLRVTPSALFGYVNQLGEVLSAREREALFSSTTTGVRRSMHPSYTSLPAPIFSPSGSGSKAQSVPSDAAQTEPSAPKQTDVHLGKHTEQMQLADAAKKSHNTIVTWGWAVVAVAVLAGLVFGVHSVLSARSNSLAARSNETSTLLVQNLADAHVEKISNDDGGLVSAVSAKEPLLTDAGPAAARLEQVPVPTRALEYDSTPHLETDIPKIEPTLRSKKNPVPKLAAAKKTEPQVVIIPEGTGRLRVGVVPQNVEGEVLINSAVQGIAPLDVKLSSGRYAVEVRFKSGGATKSTRVEVWPNRTTTLLLNTDTGVFSQP